jgi:hypothetical protein
MKQMEYPMMIAGWDGSMWMRDPDAPEEADDEHDMMSQYAVVYTDIEAPTPMDANEANYNGTTVSADGEVTIVADDAPFAASDMFPATPMEGDTAERTYKSDDTDTEDTDESAKFAGTLQGGMGMFECTGSADCTVEVDSDGMLTFSTGWTFTFDDDAEVNVQDSDYLYFGWWVDGPTGPNDDNEYSYTFQTFAGGLDTYGATIAELTGSATYEGAAAGKYVVKNVSDGNIQRADMGKFTADVTLTADFDFDFIGGMIDGFTSGDEEMEGWMVELQRADIDGLGVDAEFSAMTNATLSGMDNMKMNAGSWQGRFHGPHENDATPAERINPSGVSGRFDAHFDAAHLAGAFGAEKE